MSVIFTACCYFFIADKEAACAKLTAAFRALTGNSSQLLDCNIECCTGKNCNNQNVLPPYGNYNAT